MVNSITKSILGLLSTTLLTACQHVATQPQPPSTFEQIQTTIDESITAQPMPQPIKPPLQLEQQPVKPVVRDVAKFNVNVDRVPAHLFFMSLVEGTPYNIIVHPDIKDDISLRLKHITIADVLDIVQSSYGYDYKIGRAAIEVLPAKMRTQIFEVDYLNIERSGQSQTLVNSGQISHNLDSNDISPQARERTQKTHNIAQNNATVIHTSQPPTTFWDELETSLQAILGKKEDRVLVVNRQTSTVIVRAMPNELQEVEIFLDKMQNVAQRQVILEAKILEVILNDGSQTGIDWALLSKNSDASEMALIGQTGGGSLLPDGTHSGRIIDLTNGQGGFAPFGTGKLGSNLFGGIFSAALRLENFAAFIELLQTQGNVQVLSSPRIATLNNQKAVIKVGSDEYFVTEISNTMTVSGDTVLTNPSIELTPFFSGIALDVTPQISQEDEILLHIHPSVSEVTDQHKTITIDDEPQVLPLAYSTVRESDSIIRAMNGQVVVIGGLMKDESRESVASTPILGDIPIVGSLFRHNYQSSVKSELVILLRPIVVNNQQQWQQALRQSAKSLEQLERYFKHDVEITGHLEEIETHVIE